MKQNQELRESEQKFRIIFDDSMEGLILWNETNQIVDINGSAERIFDLPKNKLLGLSLHDLCNRVEEKKQIIMNHIEHETNNGKQYSTMVIKCNDGRLRHFDYSTRYGIVEGLNLTVIIDVTEKVEMQEQLQKSDRLNIIGELA